MNNADKAKELVAKFERSVFLSKNYTLEKCIEEAMQWKEQQIIKRTIDWMQKEATKHIGFNAISEECSLSWDFTDLLVKAMKG